MRRCPLICRHQGQTLVGTMHEPSSDATPPGDRIALLLLNAGPAPRAGNSDLSAHLCDRLAERGVVSFRFDLAGLGDSTGDSWPDIDTFWEASQHGSNDSAVAAIVEQICAVHGFRGVVLGGLCAGAIASVRLADALGEQFAGLVLLEPNFKSSAEVRNAPVAGEATPTPPVAKAKKSLARRWARKLSRLLQPNELLYFLTGESRLARPFTPIKPLLEGILARRVGRELPRDVLVSAVLSWRRLLDRGVPSLLLLAKGLGTDRYLERLQRAFPPVEPDLLRQVLVPDTNHILTAGEAQAAAIDAVEQWIEDRFPLAVWARCATTQPGGPCLGRTTTVNQ